ncbi:DUF2752 domain-containing protein [Larkinella terrae]|uniref:DUF2752 domain-containing protein n=1 Tax=Larkinella terrae TaxID=2025311 RepID=UPI001478D783|nr:DUF2752 domain-containing protein [Larkinella terrae]
MGSPTLFSNPFGRAAFLVLLLGIAAFCFWFDPSEVSFFPPCPFRLLTGLECPGCGSQRCLHQLLHGHMERAYGYNPLMVLSIPYVVTGLLLEYTPLRTKHSAFHQRFYGKTASRIAFGMVVLFGIGRNLF